MEVDYLLVADAAIAAGGKHYIHGGGWDTLVVTRTPTTHPVLAVAVRLRLDPEDERRGIDLELDVVDEMGTTMIGAPVRARLDADLTAAAAPGTLVRSRCVTFTLSRVLLAHPGRFEAVLTSGGAVLRRTPFNVVAVLDPEGDGDAPPAAAGLRHPGSGAGGVLPA
ncbi:MAG TPA: hypothetical protein VFO60_11585 [Candidatus Dormibacteraeota bacterium]|nr:hypothetical protein [Candidatus Dormibacteraeota bacterium]